MAFNAASQASGAGVPRSSDTAAPEDPAVALGLGTYGDPRGLGVSYERGAPVNGVYEGGQGFLQKRVHHERHIARREALQKRNPQSKSIPRSTA